MMIVVPSLTETNNTEQNIVASVDISAGKQLINGMFLFTQNVHLSIYIMPAVADSVHLLVIWAMSEEMRKAVNRPCHMHCVQILQ